MLWKLLVLTITTLAHIGSDAPMAPVLGNAPVDRTFAGRDGGETKPTFERIRDQKIWDERIQQLFEPALLSRPDLRLKSGAQEAVVIHLGKTSNCNGVRIFEVQEEKARVIIRFGGMFYPAGPKPDLSQPWGLVMMPQIQKTIELQENVSSFIGEKPRFERRTVLAVPQSKS